VSASELVKVADKGGNIATAVAAPVIQAADGAGFVALSLLIHEWDAIAPWLIEELFADEPSREAFRALAEADGQVHAALLLATPEGAEIIERAAVYSADADPYVEARSLIAAAVRRELPRRRGDDDLATAQMQRSVRLALDDLAKPDKSTVVAVQLLQWLAEGDG
jgi:hypothetical protein